PDSPQSSSSVNRHSSLLLKNFAAFQRAAALSAHPLLPNQWRRPVRRKIGESGSLSPPVYQVVLSSLIQFVVPKRPTGQFQPAFSSISFHGTKSGKPVTTLLSSL